MLSSFESVRVETTSDCCMAEELLPPTGLVMAWYRLKADVLIAVRSDICDKHRLVTPIEPDSLSVYGFMPGRFVVITVPGGCRNWFLLVPDIALPVLGRDFGFLCRMFMSAASLLAALKASRSSKLSFCLMTCSSRMNFEISLDLFSQ